MDNIDFSDDNKNYNENIKQVYEEQEDKEQENKEEEDKEQEDEQYEHINDVYTCDCCNLKFKNGLGFEYHLDNGKFDKNGKKTGFDDSKLWVIYDEALFNDSWRYYLPKSIRVYEDFTTCVINNYNSIHNYPENDAKIWTHLYNKHIDLNIPLDAKMYEEYMF